ncbi:hypothetical protein [Nocardia sp. NPDC057668]|uniref:hypothetical protein n=1 Tax=Nocardia sp. NPDC057668 TaxID=3346202 RepID=UPI00366F23BB
MTRLKPLRPRLRMIMSGELDRTRLDRLREALGLARKGRLTDREDEHFGYRDVSENQDRSLSLDLWRVSDAEWSLRISAAADVDLSDAEITRWQSVIAAAADANGLEISSVKVFPPPSRDNYETMWRNENWLRTAHWDLPARTLDELWWVIGIEPSASEVERRDKLAAFMTNPVWQPAPAELRQEAEAFVRRVTESEGGEQ